MKLLLKMLIPMLIAFTSLANVYAARTKQTTNKIAVSKPHSQIMKKKAPFKPARGRGRPPQLEKMTPQERKAEAEWRLEKNRQAARDCRQRRKAYVKELEAKVAEYEAHLQTQATIIATLRKKVEDLKTKSLEQDDKSEPALVPLTVDEVTEALTTPPDSADAYNSTTNPFSLESVTAGAAANSETHFPLPSHVLPAIWL